MVLQLSLMSEPPISYRNQFMNFSRRDIFKSGTMLIGAGIAAGPLVKGIGAQKLSLDSDGTILTTGFDIQDAAIREVANAAVDSAMKRGASYADVRVSFTKNIVWNYHTPYLLESMEIGVRALVDGYWGFASSPIWHTDEAARLGTSAFNQAQANVTDGPRDIHLSSSSGPKTGHWEMAAKHDAFLTHYDEIFDTIAGLQRFCRRLKHLVQLKNNVLFEKQYRAFASSDGHYQTQILNRTIAELELVFSQKDPPAGGQFIVDQYASSAGGLEVLRDKPMRKYIQHEYDEMIESWKLPIKPVDVGRFNAIIDQNGMAKIASPTIGYATELDRAMGFEANASGTSYITDPPEMLGTLRIGSPNVNVYADRSNPLGLATVAWDDEGVQPITTQLVKDGMLNDMQTNRESAAWLRSYYERTGTEPVSKGYSFSPTGMFAPLSYTPNLYIEPSQNGAKNIEELRERLGEGVEVKQPRVSLDYQQSTGFAYGQAFEIKGGKRVARLHDAGIIFRSSEIWNNINEFGAKETELQIGVQQKKGEPEQGAYHTVRSVPAIIRDVTFIDAKRKA